MYFELKILYNVININTTTNLQIVFLLNILFSKPDKTIIKILYT